MKRILMAIMAVAVAVTFSAPAFAGDDKDEKKDEKKGGNVLVYGDEKDEKKDEKKGGGYVGTFGDDDKKDEKKDEKGK